MYNIFGVAVHSNVTSLLSGHVTVFSIRHRMNYENFFVSVLYLLKHYEGAKAVENTLHCFMAAGPSGVSICQCKNTQCGGDTAASLY